MKKKIHIAAAIAVISIFNLTGLSACASEQTAAVEMQAEEGRGEGFMGQRGVMAQVTAIDGSTITIIESETKGRGGRNGGGPKGEGLDGETPELPDGEEFDGEAPEMPEGEAPDGEMKEKPEGEAPDGEAPELPDGEAPDGEAPELPDGETPERPEGKAPDGEAHERADGEMPEMTFEGEEKTITASDSIIFTEADGEKTQASLSDISEGTIIMITYDEDGTTPTEIIIRQ